MRTRNLIAPTALVAVLALVSGPAFASGDSDDVATEVATEECPAPDDVATLSDADTLQEAAEEAAEAAEELADNECESVDAHDSLQAALDRLSAEGAGGNGVAALVLQALINGESPSGIGAAHGAAMADAAKARRAEHTNHGKHQTDAPDTPDTPDAPDAPDGEGVPDDAGAPDDAGGHNAPTHPTHPVRP